MLRKVRVIGKMLNPLLYYSLLLREELPKVQDVVLWEHCVLLHLSRGKFSLQLLLSLPDDLVSGSHIHT